MILGLVNAIQEITLQAFQARQCYHDSGLTTAALTWIFYTLQKVNLSHTRRDGTEYRMCSAESFDPD